MVHQSLLEQRVQWWQEEQGQAEVEKCGQGGTEKEVDVELKEVGGEIKWNSQSTSDAEQVNENRHILCLKLLPAHFTG